MNKEELTFGTRCIYAFMGFFSAGLLSLTAAFSMHYLIRRIPLWIELICAAIFTLIFTIWGFISGQKMIDQLTHLWDKYYDH